MPSTFRKNTPGYLKANQTDLSPIKLGFIYWEAEFIHPSLLAAALFIFIFQKQYV